MTGPFDKMEKAWLLNKRNIAYRMSKPLFIKSNVQYIIYIYTVYNIVYYIQLYNSANCLTVLFFSVTLIGSANAKTTCFLLVFIL